MPKRFIETNIWKKSWWRKLPPKIKLFYIYMICNCDHAGIWSDVDLELAEFQIGMPIDEKDVLNQLGEHIEVLSDTKWFVKKFPEFQYGMLNPNVRTHASVIKILEKNNLKGYISVNKQLGKSYLPAKSKDTDTNKSKVKDKNKEKKMDEKILDYKSNGIERRRVEFCNDVNQYHKDYDKDMRIDFMDYWTEPNKSKAKMKFELEKTWDTKRRLARWSNNNFNSNKVNKSFKLDATGNAYVAYCSSCGTSDFYDQHGIKNDSICCKKELLPEHPKKGMLN